MDLVGVLDRYSVDYRKHGDHHHVRDGWVGLDCPWCGSSGKYHLGVHVKTRKCNCWRCGPRSAVLAVARACGTSAAEIEAVWDSAGFDNGAIITRARGSLVVPSGVSDMMPQHRGYLAGRGFNPDEIGRVWGVRGIGLAAHLQWRLFIPIYSSLGRMVSWTTRSISSTNPSRYVSASPEQEEMSHKSLLYGEHLARHAIVIVEGPTDAWAVGPGAVCLFGLGYSQKQIALMVNYPIRVVMFDSSHSAQKRAVSLCKDLSIYPGTTHNIEIETGEDPASASKEEIAEIRRAFLEW